MKRTMLLGAVTLALMLAAPPDSLGAPHKTKVKRAKKKKKLGKASKAKAKKVSEATRLKSKKKKGQSFNFGPMDVTAGPERPQAAYLIPKARIKYTRPSHEKELLTWIIRSMRNR